MQVLARHHIFANAKIMWKRVVLKVRLNIEALDVSGNDDMEMNVCHYFLALKDRLLGSAHPWCFCMIVLVLKNNLCLI